MVAKAKIKLPASIMDKLAAEAATIADRIGAPSGDRISVTNRKTFKTPDGIESPGPIQAVIVDFISVHSYYGDMYDPNNITPPLCAAVGPKPADLIPFSDSPEKQCDVCAACPQNQFGSATTGKGKACGNHRLLALIPDNADVDTPLQVLRLSPTALRSFDSYVASIARSYQAPPLAVITEISFDEAFEYPSLRFKVSEVCSPDLVNIALARREEAQARLAQKPDFALPADKKKISKPAGRRATGRAARL
jgi:hypothetical protein